MNRLLDIRIQKWVIFTTCNDIIDCIDKKILYLIESLTILNLVDVKVSVRLFTYQPLNPRVYLKMCLQFQKHQKRNLQ